VREVSAELEFGAKQTNAAKAAASNDFMEIPPVVTLPESSHCNLRFRRQSGGNGCHGALVAPADDLPVGLFRRDSLDPFVDKLATSRLSRHVAMKSLDLLWSLWPLRFLQQMP